MKIKIIVSLVAGFVLGLIGGYTYAKFIDNKPTPVESVLTSRAFDPYQQRALEDLIARNRLSGKRVERSEKLTGRIKDSNRRLQDSIEKAVDSAELGYNKAASGINRIEEGVKILRKGITQLEESIKDHKENE